MSEGLDVMALLANGTLDAATVERLREADLGAMRRVLGELLPDDEVDRIIARVEALRGTSTPGG